MKKIFFLLASLSIAIAAKSQDIDKATALKLVAENNIAIGLSDEDVNNAIVSNAYYDQNLGAQLVYLQQSYKGLPVINQLQTLAFKNGVLVSSAGSRLKSIAKLSNMASSTPTISAILALRTVMADKKINTNQPITGLTINGSKKINFGKLDITNEKVTAELMWLPINDGKEVRLVWQVYFVPNSTTDYWLTSVDAASNKIIGEINLTVYCNFDGDKTHPHKSVCVNQNAAKADGINKTGFINEAYEPVIVNGASYRVIPYPAESPLHAGGTADIRTNPWTLTPGNATSLKWHSDGSADYSFTRGNNVFAAEDRDGLNTTIGLPATSTTSPDPLTFDFLPDFSVAPTQSTPVQNQQFNTTNLFYWNNIIHDLTYAYGFDEVSGNFQASNQGRGGAGNDFVIADAQDGGGTNNANFATPADGGSGRMQMYLWNGNPQKDGDVDNGIIVHEFGHGISNRLAGGPAQAACVSNAEQMGEGWSDYYALMATQDWATSLLTDGFSKPRGIGTYAIGQTPAGLGIRSQRYCTNFTVNNRSYTATIPGNGQQHSRGEIWCATLWDMTWNIITQVGSINPNIFNASAGGGNSIALKLVTEGLKLQGCNAGFIDGRNGILQADQLLYAGAYRCAIMQAFARRGMGFDAIQGSANSTTDQVAGFSTIESIVTLTQNVTQQLEGLNITYNNRVAAGTCGGLTNYLLTDTLPANVTYVSGGTYNAGTRVVSFAVNIAAGQTQNYPFTVMVNNGSWFPVTNLIDEQLTTTSLPASWSTTSIDATNFVVSSAQSQSAPNALFALNSSIISDFTVATNTAIAMGATPPVLSFWHNYNTEEGWDGGVVEISTNSGTSWIDLGANMTENGYNGSMGTGSNNPIGGRAAFTGTSAGFIKTTVSLLPYANQNVFFRFRMASDDNTAITGWYVDDILLQSRALVNMRSSLFNGAGTRVNVKDTFTIIIQNVGCTPAAITTQPASTSTCAGTNTSFSIVATGTTLAFQWQVSTDGGVSYNNVAGATAATLNVTAVTTGMNNNRYRVIVSNACPSSVTSAGAILTVSDAATVTTQPANSSVCLNENISFSVSASGSALTYQWQVSTDAGVSFNNITGATNATINIIGVTAGMNNNRYRAVVFSCSPTGTNSNAAILSITSPANFTTPPAAITICPGDNASFSVAVNGSSITYQWQISINNGSTFSNIPGAINSTLNLSNVSISANGYQYRVVINGTCTIDLASPAGVLNVNTPVTITTQPQNILACAGSSASLSVAATGTTLSYQWQLSINGGAFVNLANSATYTGVTLATLNITAISPAMGGNAYRVLVSGPPCGTVISNISNLIAYPLPGVVLAASAYNRLTPAVSAVLYSTVSPAGTYTYQWFKNGTLVAGITSNSYPVNVDRLGNYTVTVTDGNGCRATSNLVPISDSASSQLFIYANPNNGRFQVRYYNTNNTKEQRTLNIYDAKGAKVFSKKYEAASPYERMEVNLTNAQAGVYSIDLRDNNGKRLASGSVIIE